jgi:hypothetical protein
MAGVTVSSGGQPGVPSGTTAPPPLRRQAVASRLAMLSRGVERSRQMSWDVRQIMLVVGAVAMALGFVAIVLGWYGASHSAFVFQEIPYMISGGLLGIALVAGGGFLFFAAWLVRLIEENRNANARMARTLDRVDRVLDALSTAGAGAMSPLGNENGGGGSPTPSSPSPSSPSPFPPGDPGSPGGGWS